MRTLDEVLVLRRRGESLLYGDSSEAHFLAESLDRYLAVTTPFAGYLEAPEAVIQSYARHGEACNAAADALRAAMRPVLEELLAVVEREQRRGHGDLV